MPTKALTKEQVTRLEADTGPYRLDHECAAEAALRRISELESENAALEAENERLRARMCLFCASGRPVVNGKHRVERLSECEPNESTDERSTVVDWIPCLCETSIDLEHPENRNG